MRWPFSRTRTLITLIAFILLAGMTGHLPIASADPTSDELDQAIASTMKVWTLDANMKIIASCTGTVVDPTGYVLTNFHCVGLVSDEKDQGKPGTLYNPKGLLAVGPTLDPKKAPVPTYMAKFMAGNYDLDVAVLKIYGMVSQNQKLPDPLPVVPITLADSDQVNIGDYVGVIGYPGVGGNTVTVTDGKIAGFDDENGDGTLDSFKVTASINPGNSGGLAIDGNGKQIGIPAWSLYNEKTGSKLDRAIMVNVAVPYIQKAIDLGSTTAGVIPPTGPSNNPPNNPPDNPSSNPVIGALKFGTDYKSGQLVGAATKFKSGISKVMALFDYDGMDNSLDWGRTWAVDGQTIAGKSSGYQWDGDVNGSYTLQLYNDKGPLPDGNYKVTVYVDGAPAQTGTFSIGSGAPPPKQTPAPPPPSSKGVTLKGQIVDADTQRGISGALFLVFKPGTTQDEIVAGIQGGSLDPLLAAAANSDQGGNYQTAPPLARGQTYSVMIVADGYKIRFFDNGLEISSSDPAITKMSPIALQKE
ncbi:MAG: serine protease [Chloroflexi bacterium]|nr:serine protease [Chloroflexota bacterium]MCL5952243.1 serine protease [Chloroflexota bacterium]